MEKETIRKVRIQNDKRHIFHLNFNEGSCEGANLGLYDMIVNFLYFIE